MTYNSIQSILYILPQGKPDPKLSRKAGDNDTRERVEQKPQKGPTCWYYAQKIISQQFGKKPDESFSTNRKFEKLASNYRKELTAARISREREEGFLHICKLNPRQIERTHSSDPKFLKEREQEKEKCLNRNFPSEEYRKFCSEAFDLITSFITQTECLDINEFFLQKQKQRLFDIHNSFLGALNINPEQSYKNDLPNLSFCCNRDMGVKNSELTSCSDLKISPDSTDTSRGKSEISLCGKNSEKLDIFDASDWKKLKNDDKLVYLSTLAINATAKICRNLKESSWRPDHTIENLIKELHDRGPLFVCGKFGKGYYQKDPISMSKKFHEKTIWYWPAATSISDTPDQGSHSVVIIGANTLGTRGGLVYFVDPLDGSDPSNPEQQRIYAISFQRLTQNIFDLLGQHFISDNNEIIYSPKTGYAMYADRKPDQFFEVKK